MASVAAAAAPMLQGPCPSPRPRLCWLLFQPNPPLYHSQEAVWITCRIRKCKGETPGRWTSKATLSSEWDALWELCLEAKSYNHLSYYSFGESSELLLTCHLTVHPSGQCAYRIVALGEGQQLCSQVHHQLDAKGNC